MKLTSAYEICHKCSDSLEKAQHHVGSMQITIHECSGAIGYPTRDRQDVMQRCDVLPDVPTYRRYPSTQTKKLYDPAHLAPTQKSERVVA